MKFKYRIREHRVDGAVLYYSVEKRVFFWWDIIPYASCFYTVQEARDYINGKRTSRSTGVIEYYR